MAEITTPPKREMAAKKDFMTVFPAELTLDIFTRLPVRDTWRLRCVSKLWNEKLSSEDPVKKALFRWDSHESSDESGRETVEARIRTLRQHHRRYPAVQIMAPIMVSSVEQPFMQTYSTAAEPLLISHFALICMDEIRYRYEVVDLKLRTRQIVPLPPAFNQEQDQYQDKALGTKLAAFLRKDLCYLFNLQTGTTRPIALPSSKHHIKMLAVAVHGDQACIVYRESSMMKALLTSPSSIGYIRLGAVRMITPETGSLCTAFLNEKRCIVFFIEGSHDGVGYNVGFVDVNLITSESVTIRLNLNLNLNLQDNGTLSWHSTGIQDDIRVEVASTTGIYQQWCNIGLDLQSYRANVNPGFGCGDTVWKNGAFQTRGRVIRYGHLTPAGFGRARAMKGCFAMHGNVDKLPICHEDIGWEQYVVTNESYCITGTCKQSLPSDGDKLAWDFFSWDDEDEGIPLVVKNERLSDGAVVVGLARCT